MVVTFESCVKKILSMKNQEKVQFLFSLSETERDNMSIF